MSHGKKIFSIEDDITPSPDRAKNILELQSYELCNAGFSTKDIAKIANPDDSDHIKQLVDSLEKFPNCHVGVVTPRNDESGDDKLVGYMKIYDEKERKYCPSRYPLIFGRFAMMSICKFWNKDSLNINEFIVDDKDGDPKVVGDMIKYAIKRAGSHMIFIAKYKFNDEHSNQDLVPPVLLGNDFAPIDFVTKGKITGISYSRTGPVKEGLNNTIRNNLIGRRQTSF